MTSLLVCLLALQPTAKVDLVLTASPARVVAERICAPAGLEVRVAPALAQKPVVVRLQQADPLDAMRKLAWALDADLKRDGETLVIERSAATRRRIEDDEVARRRRMIQDAIAEFKSPEPYSRAFLDGTVAKVRGVAERMETQGRVSLDEFGLDLNSRPGFRLVRRAILALGADGLASVDLGDRVVFSNMPTPLQRELPQGDALARAYLQDTAAMHRALTGAGLELSWMSSGSANKPGWQPATDPKDLVVLVEVKNHYGTPTVAAIVGRRDGSIESFATQDLSPEWMAPQPLPWPEAMGTFQASHRAQSLHAVFRGGALELGAKGINELKATGIDPLLGGGQSEVFIQYAAAREEDLIACLSDDLGIITYDGNALDLMPQFVGLSLGYVAENVADSDWIVLRPQSTAFAERTAASRECFWNALRIAARDSVFSLDAQIALAEQPNMEFRLDIVSLISEAVGRLDSGDVSWDVLGIVGAIPAGARDRLDQGVAYGSLPALARERISRFIYGGFHTDSPREHRSGMLWTQASSPEHLRDEPTMRLAAGIPSNAIVRVLLKPTSGLLFSTTSGGGWTEFVGEGERFDERILRALESSIPGSDGEWISLDRVQLAKEALIHVQIELSERDVFSTTTSTDLRAEGKPVPIADLPGPLGDRIRAHLEKNPQR